MTLPAIASVALQIMGRSPSQRKTHGAGVQTITFQEVDPY